MVVTIMKENLFYTGNGDETFGIYNGVAKLHRYRFEYITQEQVDPTADEIVMEDVLNVLCFTDKATCDEYEKAFKQSETEYTITEIDQTGNEWIDGMEFKYYQNARQVLDYGLEWYERSKISETDKIMLAVTELYEMMLGGVNNG